MWRPFEFALMDLSVLTHLYGFFCATEQRITATKIPLFIQSAGPSTAEDRRDAFQQIVLSPQR